MKRLIGAVLAAGGLAAAAIASGGSAGASLRPHHETTTYHPVLTLSKSANLKAQGVFLSGTGYPPNVTLTLAECNSDGAIPLITEGCATAAHDPTTNASGDFTKFLFKVQAGALKTFVPDPNTAAPADCPQIPVQASHGVACVIAAADLSIASATDFVPVYFKAPTFKTSVTKGDKKKGVQTYQLHISQTGDYANPNAGGTIGGFAVGGTIIVKGKPVIGECQAASSGHATWPSVGLPTCTGVEGEPIKVLINNKLIKTVTTSTSASNAGGVVTKVDGLKKGKYNVELLGTFSGEEVEVLHVVVG
jgi:hypothetical protein